MSKLLRAIFFIFMIALPAKCFAESSPTLIIPKVYSTVGKWVVGSNDRGSCLAAADVSNGLEIWVGYMPDGDTFLGFFNNDWASLEDGKKYKITQTVAGSGKWLGDYVAMQRVNSKGQKFKGLMQYGLSQDFVSQLTKSSSLTISYDDNSIATVNLKQAGTILKELQGCRSALAKLENGNGAVANTNETRTKVAVNNTSVANAETRTGGSGWNLPQNERFHSGRRVALIIGNGAYKYAPSLSNPTKDADALSNTFKAVGFDSVIEVTDQTQQELLKALKQFSKEADGAEWAVVYYSGHGIEVSGKNYLIPVDAQMKVDRDVELETVDVGKLLAATDGAKKLKLVVLDACRDNPFSNQMRRTVATRSIGRGLAQLEPEAGTLVVYAAKHGAQALDGDGTNSPFAASLINHIKTPGLEVRRLFDSVRDDVMETTQGQQQPFVYGSLSAREDFYFVQK
jgi:hypothetical protein